MRKRAVLILVCLTCLYGFQPAPAPKFTVTADLQAALDHIRPDSLRGDLSFIASDLLEGRKTPSRGLDIAAVYIAAQFRRAGLEPAGDDGYFATAHMAVLEPNLDGFELKLSSGENVLAAGAKDVAIDASAALDLKETPVFKLDLSDQAFVEGFKPAEVTGKVVIVEITRGAMAKARIAIPKIRQGKPALTITIDRMGASVGGPPEGVLLDPKEPQDRGPRITLGGGRAASFFDSLPAGSSGAVASIHCAAPHEKPVSPRNVIGVLRGADAALKDTYVLVTAHYDHIGMLPEGDGDRVYNGANDDGSGTVSVIELARALSGLKQRPRRSIVFMTFFGEEEGMLGSKYYTRHPALPLAQTVAQLNLEQLGRTDSSEGPQVSNASLTGFDYSTIAGFVQAAGQLTGVKVYKHPRNSDAFFAQSDNLYLAEAGVPAHTLSVSFQFPDYHGLGDEWQKIDYDNMAKVDRMVALALVMLANSEEPPHWNEQNPRAAKYIRKL
ncbi:MAG TPA: M28 family peptidase [Bryobacteraceae bacterium]